MMLIATLTLATMGITQLPPQKVAPGRCVTFLWTRSETPLRIAMLDETARTLRLARGKQMLDFAQTAPGVYAGNGMTITANLEFSDRQGLTNGSLVEAGVLRIDLAGQDSEAFPVGGIRACQ